MNDSAFIAAADAALATIGDALDSALANSDRDVDWNVNDGILEIECEDGGKLIVNRHVPNREIWVAARSGGYHFRSEGGVWRDTRSGDELGAVLERLLDEQAGLAVRLAPLARGVVGLGTRFPVARIPERARGPCSLVARSPCFPPRAATRAAARSSREARGAVPRARAGATRPSPRTAASG